MYTMQMGWGFRRHHTNLSLHVSVIHYTVNYNVLYRSVRYGKHSLRYFRSFRPSDKDEINFVSFKESIGKGI